jgi:NadR type nicotinamide-nucleotide adenylyltransferase
MSPLVVVVTGSECTGKSTLAAALAERFAAPLSLEYARQYVEHTKALLDASDVEPIARGQLAGELAAEQAAARVGARIVVRDTDLISTVVYSRHYYGGCPPWVVSAAIERVGGLYLLLTPDVPWMPDGVRDRPDAAVRAEIHHLFVETLAAAGALVVDIGGDWQARETAAVAVVSAAMAEGSPRAASLP